MWRYFILWDKKFCPTRNTLTHTYTHTQMVIKMTLSFFFSFLFSNCSKTQNTKGKLLCKEHEFQDVKIQQALHRLETHWSMHTVHILSSHYPLHLGNSGFRQYDGYSDIIIIIKNNNRIQRRYSGFFTISSQHHKLSPTRTLKWPRRNRVQITCNTSSAFHVQVSCYVPLGTKGQLSY